MARPQFSSRFATLLAMAAFAVGVGNVWRFPYMMGQNGGSAFLMIYLAFVIALAVPALVGEWSLGRATRSGPVTAFREALGPRFGLGLGFLFLFSTFVALSYYTIIVGNVIYTAWFALRHGFDPQTITIYENGLGNDGQQFLFAIGLTAACLWIVHRGLQGGIEKVNMALMPIFVIVVVYMVGVTLTLEGAAERLVEFLKPDFRQAGPRVWFAAMGQACFSIGISGAIGVVYGSYMREKERLVPSAVATGFIDTGAALMASLFVVPAVLVFGLDLAAGPTLLFNTLPHLFEVMPGGRWLAGPFLAAWALVAVLTIVAAFETVVSALHDYTGEKCSRNRWIWITGAALIAIMLPTAFNPHIIGNLDLIFGSGMFMLGSTMAVIAVGWGLGKAVLKAQITLGLKPHSVKFMAFWIRYVVPVAMFVILAGFILQSVGLI